MDTAWLIDFLALAETGSFSRTAEQRNLTQPAFSRRIRALEDWLGAPLFDRSIVPVELTYPGRLFLPEARKLVEGIETAQRIVRAAAQTGSTSLALATMDLLAAGFAPVLFGLTGDGSEQAVVNVSVVSARDAEAMLARGQCQLLLRHHHEAFPVRMESPDFVQTTIARDWLVAVGSPDIVMQYEPGEPQQRIPLLAHDEGTLLGTIFAEAIARPLAHIGFDAVFVSQSAALLHAMALRGKGLAWLPLSLTYDDLQEGRLRAITEPRWREPVDIVLVRNKAPGSKVLETFWSKTLSLDASAFGLFDPSIGSALLIKGLPESMRA